MPRLRTVAFFALLGLLGCGRTTPYEALRAGQPAEDGGGGAGGSTADAGSGAGGGGGELELPPGCEASDVKFTGVGPQPPPAGIPRIAFGLTPGLGLTGSAPWFDFSTGLLAGTASRNGKLTVTFEGVAVRVRVDAGDTAAVVADRLVRCGRVPGYRFETTAPPNTFVGVRREDSRVFARIFVENSRMDPRFVFEDDEAIPYWLAIVSRTAATPLLLSARDKPICEGGVQAHPPTEKKLGIKQGVLFSWDGTHFTDGGACLRREMFDGGLLILVACARLTAAATGADPFTRADAGMAVDCIAQQAVLGPSAPGAPTAIVFNW